jgi:hypothetical protein
MASKTVSSNPKEFPSSPLNYYSIIVILTVTASLMLSAIGHADTNWSAIKDSVSIVSVLPSKKDSYGYKLQYYVPVSITALWRFKTDFRSDILLTNKEIIEHRVVESTNKGVITENRYAAAPGLKFLMK